MTRIDLELINRKLFKTRTKAQYAIKKGCVYCNNIKIEKPNYKVNDYDKIMIKGTALPYVSKGGLKLERAIKKFQLNLKDKIMMDIGASTGGFSDCAIKNGIKHIIAVDVGNNQFSDEVYNTGKVTLYENTDIRTLDKKILKNINVITIDVSFISVLKIIKVFSYTDAQEIILLIKPQFEAGIETANKYKGIVLDKEVHKSIIKKIIMEFSKINYNIQDLCYSPIKGGSGNIEYLAYFRNNTLKNNINIDKVMNLAFKNLVNS